MASVLILGCANCVWDDAEKAMKLFTPDAVIAVKDMIVKWPGRVDYGINLHPERTEGYLRDRRLAGRNIDFEVWTNKVKNTPKDHRLTTDWAGSSGLLGVKVALMEGFDPIILAGVPMLQQLGHVARGDNWIDFDNKQSVDVSCYYGGWKKRKPEMIDKVRSMSGWTMTLLGGEPTQAWIESRSVKQRHEVAI